MKYNELQTAPTRNKKRVGRGIAKHDTSVNRCGKLPK